MARRPAEGRTRGACPARAPAPPSRALWSRPPPQSLRAPRPWPCPSQLVRTRPPLQTPSPAYPPPSSPGRPLPATAGIQMQRFSRQNEPASPCRKRARPCRKAGRRAFRFSGFGRVAAPGGRRCGPGGFGRLGPGCRGVGRKCGKLSAPRRVLAPGGAGDPSRARVAPGASLRAPAQRPDGAAGASFSLSPSRAAPAGAAGGGCEPGPGTRRELRGAQARSPSIWPGGGRGNSRGLR